VPTRSTMSMLSAAILLASPGLVLANPDALVPSGGPAPDLFLIYTGDVIGYVEPCG
jgi:hypothetical protein